MNERLQLVSFQIGTEMFAVSIAAVQEVIRMTHLVKIPKSFDFVEGLINLRGKIVPVIDLRKRFGMEVRNPGALSRIIVTEFKGVTVGLQVDAVCTVLRTDLSFFEETPAFVSSIDQKFIKGIIKQKDKIIMVLDLEKLFSPGETQLLKQVQ
jgi:purine-binding chemotaxis protein CheW